MNTLQIISEKIHALGPRGPGKRIPETLQAEAVQAAKEARRRGMTIAAIVCELGICRQSLHSWMLKMGENRPMGNQVIRPLTPVALVPIQMITSPSTPSSGLILRSPQGWEVTGLNIEQVIDILRAL